MKFAAGIFLVAAAAPLLVHAYFPTDRELENEQCSSTAYQTVARLTVENLPVAPIDVLRFPQEVGLLKLECFQVFESMSNPSQLASDSERRSCAASNAAISICSAPADSRVPDAAATWTCSSLEQYVRQPITGTTWGVLDGPPLRFKFQWQPQGIDSRCFPRDLTVQMVAHAPRKPGASVAASVVFILLVVAVGLGVAAFGLYQIHKSITQQFKRGEQQDPNPPTGEEPEDLEDGVNRALGFRDEHADHTPLHQHRDDVYVDHEELAVTITDQNEVLESKPMPKPWYERVNYDGNRAAAPAPAGGGRPESIQRTYRSDMMSTTARENNFTSPGPADRGSAIRRRTPAGSRGRSPATNAYDDPRAGANRRVPAPTYENRSLQLQESDTDTDEADETVLVCGDCGLPIHDRNTPQFCAPTGLRHY